MTTATVDDRCIQTDPHGLTRGDARLTADDIARRCGVPLDIAWEAIRIAVEEGYLDRDEFGTYAPWCRWPRSGI